MTLLLIDGDGEVLDRWDSTGLDVQDDHEGDAVLSVVLDRAAATAIQQVQESCE